MKYGRLTMLFTAGIFLCLLACNSSESSTRMVKGDLYFDFFRIGNFYHQPDSTISAAKQYADTVNRVLLDSANLKILQMYEVLKKEQLLYTPFIDLKLSNDSIIKVYLDRDQYEKIKIFKRADLLAEMKKVSIELKVRDLGPGMALSLQLISINKIDGQTGEISKKLKIEDYQ